MGCLYQHLRPIYGEQQNNFQEQYSKDDLLSSQSSTNHEFFSLLMLGKDFLSFIFKKNNYGTYFSTRT